MAVTILEALQNAEYNFSQKHGFSLGVAKEQLHNAIGLLERGYGIYDNVEPLLEKHGAVENVPNKE